MEIRKALPSDALGIAIVNVYTWKMRYSGLIPEKIIDARIYQLEQKAEVIRKKIEKGEDYLVALVEETIVGFCAYGACEDVTYTDFGEIKAIYILDGFQNRTIGKQLLKKAQDLLKLQGYNRIVINCLKHNPSANFYRHMGGKLIGNRQDDYNGYLIEEDIFLFES